MKKENILKNNKKKGLLLLFTLILGLGISLASVYFIYSYRDSRENEIATGLVALNFNGEETINLLSDVPVVDDVGMDREPYEFTVKNTSKVPINVKFELDIDSETNINLSAVRYALFINDQMVVKDYVHDDLILYTYDNLDIDESINCKMYFWVDYYYDIPEKIFKSKIKAEGASIDVIFQPVIITFDANDGIVSPSSKQIDRKSSRYGELPTPEKDGYEFDGWYTASSGGEEVTSSTTFTYGTSQTTLYAHWK